MKKLNMIVLVCEGRFGMGMIVVDCEGRDEGFDGEHLRSDWLMIEKEGGTVCGSDDDGVEYILSDHLTVDEMIVEFKSWWLKEYGEDCMISDEDFQKMKNDTSDEMLHLY